MQGEYSGYRWSDERGCFVKEYGSKTDDAKTFLVYFRHNYGDRCLAIVHMQADTVFTNIAAVWYVAGQVLEDCRNVAFEDISEIYSVDDDLDLLKWMNEYEGQGQIDI